MRIPAFRKERTNDSTLNGVQDQVSALSRALRQIPILDGNLVEDIEIEAGTAKRIDHKLERTYLGYLVLSKSANSNIWDTASTTPHRTLMLNASVTCTVTLWIF